MARLTRVRRRLSKAELSSREVIEADYVELRAPVRVLSTDFIDEPFSPYQTLCWCSSGPERNQDSLPDELTPPRGCPECGSVFVELVGIGYHPPYPVPGIFLPADWVVSLHAGNVRPCGAELLCAEGHLVRYYGHTRRLESLGRVGWPSDVSVSLVGPFYAMAAAR